MTEPAGRAAPFLVGAAVAASVLLAVAIAVVLSAPVRRPVDARATVRPSPSRVPEPTATPGPSPGTLAVVADPESPPTPEELGLLERLVAFARTGDSGTLSEMPLSSDGVWLGLAGELVARRTPVELADTAAWTLARDAFRGYVGPFSALDLLRNPAKGGMVEVHELIARVGPHARCAAAPVPPAPGLEGHRRLSIEPVLIGSASCLSWWSVDLFVDGEGMIEALTLDLWEP